MYTPRASAGFRTKEEVGRLHQGMDRPGVRQVPEGSGEQGKIEETGCEIICGAPTTLAVKGLMMMMIFRGHSTREPASGTVTYFILPAFTGTMR